jgi:hypothetical protein
MKTHRYYLAFGDAYSNIVSGVFFYVLIIYRRNLNPKVIFAFLMFITSIFWADQILRHSFSWSHTEDLLRLLSNYTIIVLSFMCLVAFKFNKHILLKISTGSLCYVCLVLGIVGFLIDCGNHLSTPNEFIVEALYMTDLIRILFSGGLIMSKNQ